MAEIFLEETANDVWKQAVSKLLEDKNIVSGRNGDVYEMLHAFITIKNPRQKWIYDRIPPMSIGYALAELVWMVNGEDQADIINAWNPSLPQYAGCESKYYGAYGKRIRYQFGFDQLEAAYNALQKNPESRQVVIQIYDTKLDFPMKNGMPRNPDIPCNICSILKVRNGKLEWTQIMRSSDILLGIPYNFVQFTGLQEILAGWLELEVGEYCHYSDSLHLYCRDVNKIKIAPDSKIYNHAKISICKSESKRLFEEIYHRMKKLINVYISENEISSIANLQSQYVAYNDMLLIITAYRAYKLHYAELAQELIDRCTNPVYKVIWNRWITK